MSDTALTRSSRSNAIYEAPSNIEQIKSGKVKENEKVESVQPVQNKEKPTVQKTDLKSSGEMVIELDNSIKEAENKPIQELNSRGSKVFSTTISQEDMDDIALSETTDDAKPVQHEGDTNLIKGELQKGIGTLITKLDGTLMKEGVYKKAEEFGKNLVQSTDPKSKLAFELSFKSPAEIKDNITEVVFGSKEKYTPDYQKAVHKYTQELSTKNELKSLRQEFVSLKNSNPEKAEIVKQKYIQHLQKFDPALYNTEKANIESGTLPRDNDVRRIGNPPKIYDFLPPNKQVLVDRIFKGISEAPPPNRISGLKSIDSLPPKEAERLEKYLKQAGKAAANSGPTVQIPESIMFQGKKYDYDKLLGGGGDGIAFLMKDNEGNKIVVKAPVYGDLPAFNQEVDSTIKSEIKTHLAAVGDGNKNVLELKGMIRNNDKIFTVTEFAKGGELNDVVDSIKKAPISDDNKALLKVLMMKDSVQGLQYVQTERNMSHYDVKPKNFFVGEDGTSKIADFGRAGFGHKVESKQSTPAYSAPESRRNPSEKVDTFAMGISLDEILNNKDYEDPNVNYERKEDTPLNKLISKMTSDEPSERPTLTAVLQHSVFNNPTLNNPDVVDKSRQLISAIIDNRVDDITRINDELTELLKK